MTVEYHGGACCGLSHVFEFPHEASATWLDDQMEYAVEGVEGDNQEMVDLGERPKWRGAFGHAIEVCLTDQQMCEWAPTLKAKGFRLNHRWLNDNSGNYCNLLTWAPKEPSKPRPFHW